MMAIDPMPPRAGLHLPRFGAALSLFQDPTRFFQRARKKQGDTFWLDVFGRTLFCVFSPGGVRTLWATPEATASKGLADFEMLRHKVPDDLFAGRRTLPHDLFARDDVAEYLKNVEQATEQQIGELGREGEFEVFDFMRRFGHRVGLASWGGVRGQATRHLDSLIRALDTLDSSESFVHPQRALQTVLSGKRREKAALAELESIYAEILSDRAIAEAATERSASTSSDRPTTQEDLFDRIRRTWSDTPSPDREIGIARDVVLVHMGSMSNLFAASAWTLIQLLDRPPLVNAIRAGDDGLLERSAHEAIRLRQKSIVLRRALHDFDFDDGDRVYRIPAGVFLATTMAVTNLDSLPGLERFDPGNFDGARFVRRNELATPELVTTFGHGRHSCPAMRFSMTTIRTLVGALFREFDFEPQYSNPEPLRRQIGGVARADRPCPVRYRRKQ